MKLNRWITAIAGILAIGMFPGNSNAWPMRGLNMYNIQQGMPEGPAVVVMTDDLQFDPPFMVVSVGATIVWRNVSSSIHSVTDTPGAEAYRGDATLPPGAAPFDSGNIAPGAFYSHTFSVPGTYTYYCRHHEHQGMVGQVVVMP
jgi:plastocyanin